MFFSSEDVVLCCGRAMGWDSISLLVSGCVLGTVSDKYSGLLFLVMHA